MGGADDVVAPEGETVGGDRSGGPEAAIAHLRGLLAGRGSGSARQDFAVVPIAPGQPFLIPVASPVAARRSLTRYAALRPAKVRWARRALAALWRVGVAGVVLRRRVQIPAGEGTLLGRLGEVLGANDLTFAAGLRRAGSFYTPVLQLFRPDGNPVAYAKIGWDAVTSDQVRHETEALGLMASVQPASVRAPRLLYAGVWEGLQLCVTAPMPARARRLRGREKPPVAPLAEVAALDGPPIRSSVRESHWWRAVQEERQWLEIQAPDVAGALDLLDRRFGDAAISTGRWHGDWVAWNMALVGRELFVWDWEYSRPNVPVGLDLLHYYFQESFVARGRPLRVAFADSARAASAGLGRLGVAASDVEALAALHRFEVRLRAERAVRMGAEPERRVRDVPASELLEPGP